MSVTLNRQRQIATFDAATSVQPIEQFGLRQLPFPQILQRISDRSLVVNVGWKCACGTNNIHKIHTERRLLIRSDIDGATC